MYKFILLSCLLASALAVPHHHADHHGTQHDSAPVAEESKPEAAVAKPAEDVVPEVAAAKPEPEAVKPAEEKKDAVAAEEKKEEEKPVEKVEPKPEADAPKKEEVKVQHDVPVVPLEAVHHADPKPSKS